MRISRFDSSSRHFETFATKHKVHFYSLVHFRRAISFFFFFFLIFKLLVHICFRRDFLSDILKTKPIIFIPPPRKRGSLLQFYDVTIVNKSSTWPTEISDEFYNPIKEERRRIISDDVQILLIIYILCRQ